MMANLDTYSCLTFFFFFFVCLQVKVSFKAHQARVTGLAFSTVLGVLVSSGSDGQVRSYAWFVNYVKIYSLFFFLLFLQFIHSCVLLNFADLCLEQGCLGKKG